MTSNKKKRSTPHKSPHKSHKAGTTHKSPKEKVAPARESLTSLPILPQKNAEAAPPILPPTRRILFPQSLKKSNSQQPFPSPHAVKIEHQKTKKHTLSSPAARFSDDRLLKKQYLSSPPPAKRTKLLPVTPEWVNGRKRTIPSSDDEDENEIKNEDDTPSPPSQKRKSNVVVNVAGSHKKTPPPRTSAAAVILPKQRPSSSFSTLHPNSPAVQKIDITVLRLEREELQHRLDASTQQAQKAANDIKKWESKCKETTDVQDNLNRLLRAEIEDKESLQEKLESFKEQAHILNLSAKNWEKQWKKADEDNKSLRKRHEPNLKIKTRKEDEPTADTEQCRHRYTTEKEKTINFHHELKQIKNNPETPHLTQKISKLELELSNLKSEQYSPKFFQEKPQEDEEEDENLESTNPLLEKQITQLQEALQHQTQQSTLQTRHLHSELAFKSDLLSQAERTHALATKSLHLQIAELKQQVQSHDQMLSELAEIKKEREKMREEILDRKEEIEILSVEFEEERRRLEGEVRMKDRGLERMGVLVAGWVLKWRSLGGGGAMPGVEGLGICVDGVRM